MKRMMRQLVVGLLLVTSGAVATSAPHVGAADPATFRGLTPARLLDTRTPFVTVDGAFGGTGVVAAGTAIDVVVTGRGGVPGIGAGSVALNVTVTEPAASGYVTVYPTGANRPTASNLNYVAGQSVPNMVIVGIGTEGSVTLFSSSATHLVVDVLGWFPAGGAFTPVTPARLLETRRGLSTVDGLYNGGGIGNPRQARGFAVKGRGGVPNATGAAAAVALNVTSTENTLPGFFTVYPGNTTRGTASNLNFTGGQTVPNMVIVPLPASGTVEIFNGSDGQSHMVVDVLGWFPAGPSFTGLSPTRLMDTRAGESTVDGRFLGTGPVGPAAVQNLDVTERAGVPATNVGAVALNVTVTNPTTSGYLTIYPKGAERPTASNLNFSIGQTIANMVIVPVGADGEISLFNFTGNSDVIVDVLGWFPTP
jgi:hypothetical protein